MDWPVRKLQVCNLLLILFAQAEQQKVNKHPKFDNNFDILCQFEHFEYEMNWTLVKIEGFYWPKIDFYHNYVS